jgi:hypothetical protein
MLEFFTRATFMMNFKTYIMKMQFRNKLVLLAASCLFAMGCKSNGSESQNSENTGNSSQSQGAYEEQSGAPANDTATATGSEQVKSGQQRTDGASGNNGSGNTGTQGSGGSGTGTSGAGGNTPDGSGK